MDNIQCQCMTIMVALLILNVALVIGIFFKWQTALKACKFDSLSDNFLPDFGQSNHMLKQEVPRQYSFIVQLGILNKTNEEQCSGVILSQSWVLTAGHCIEILKHNPLSSIIIYDSQYSTHKVALMLHHDDYNNFTYNVDIGLIKVLQPFKNKAPVKIASSNYNYEVNKTVSAIGWKERHYKYKYLKHASISTENVLILDQEYCKKLYKKVNEVITDFMFCGGSYEEEKPNCHFESGGPLLDQDLLIGIVSWGRDCSKIGRPVVYTKISQFSEWISNITVNF